MFEEGNNFDDDVILDDGVGAIANPGSYVGFGRAEGGTESTGPRIYAGTGDPNGTVTAPLGSLWLRSDVAGFYRNTDGATTWVAV